MAWHDAYDDPNSALSWRPGLVRQAVRAAMEHLTRPIRAISLCAGEGSHLIGAVQGHRRRADPSARPVELDPKIARHAAGSAGHSGLGQIEVVHADASDASTLAGTRSADLGLRDL
ncbi:MAG: hypothetical protein ACRDVP_02530 [Acidimicrobiales bacterium]